MERIGKTAEPGAAASRRRRAQHRSASPSGPAEGTAAASAGQATAASKAASASEAAAATEATAAGEATTEAARGRTRARGRDGLGKIGQDHRRALGDPRGDLGVGAAHHADRYQLAGLLARLGHETYERVPVVWTAEVGTANALAASRRTTWT